jgi:hypothetical protein
MCSKSLAIALLLVVGCRRPDVSKSAGQPPVDAEWKQDVISSIAQRNCGAAMNALDRVEAPSRDEDWFLFMSNVAADCKQPERSTRTLEEGITKLPRAGRLRLHKALFLAGRGDLDTARRVLAEAKAIAEDNLKAAHSDDETRAEKRLLHDIAFTERSWDKEEVERAKANRPSN